MNQSCHGREPVRPEGSRCHGESSWPPRGTPQWPQQIPPSTLGTCVVPPRSGARKAAQLLPPRGLQRHAPCRCGRDGAWFVRSCVRSWSTFHDAALPFVLAAPALPGPARCGRCTAGSASRDGLWCVLQLWDEPRGQVLRRRGEGRGELRLRTRPAARRARGTDPGGPPASGAGAHGPDRGAPRNGRARRGPSSLHGRRPAAHAAHGNASDPASDLPDLTGPAGTVRTRRAPKYRIQRDPARGRPLGLAGSAGCSSSIALARPSIANLREGPLS